MTDPHVEKRIREIISEQLGIAEDEVTPESTFTGDLGADSLDLVELVLAFEEEFDIEISEDAAERIECVSDIATLLGRPTN